MHLRKAERITHHHPASGTNFKHSSHGRPYLTLCVTIALGPAVVVTFTIIDRCEIFPQQLQHNQEWRPRGGHRRTFPCSQQCPACIQTASSISPSPCSRRSRSDRPRRGTHRRPAVHRFRDPHLPPQSILSRGADIGSRTHHTLRVDRRGAQQENRTSRTIGKRLR